MKNHALLIESLSFICRNFVVEPPVSQMFNKRLKRHRKSIIADTLSRKNCDRLKRGEVNVRDKSNIRNDLLKQSPSEQIAFCKDHMESD